MATFTIVVVDTLLPGLQAEATKRGLSMEGLVTALLTERAVALNRVVTPPHTRFEDLDARFAAQQQILVGQQTALQEVQKDIAALKAVPPQR